MVRKSENNNPNNRLLYDPNQRNARRLGAFSMEENNIDDEETMEPEEEQEENASTLDEEQTNNEASNDSDGMPTQGTGSPVRSTFAEGAKKLAKNAGKKVASVVGKAAAKLGAFIAANPWVLIVIAGLILIFILILYFAGESESSGYYDTQCNFNNSNVVLTTCGTEESRTMLIDEYVLGITNAYVKGKDMQDDAIKALMIVIKTNALSYGGYNSSSKTLTLDDCYYKYDGEYEEEERKKLDELYSSIENYIFVSSSYDDAISYLYSTNALTLNDEIVEEMNEIAALGNSYNVILNSIYNSDTTDSTENEYRSNLYIGDSRMQGMLLAGVVNNSNTVYGVGYGYNWLVGNGDFSSSYTNATSGAISGINAKMTSGKSYNIIIWLGVNDYSSKTAETYYNKYYELATNEWKNHNIYIISVGPVDDSKAVYVNNEGINNFNAEMNNLIANSNVTNLKFVNINYAITSYDSEGLHYGNDDYKNIFNMIQSNIKVVLNDNLTLYDLSNYCTFYTLTDNKAYWWPIGSATATKGNIYGGTPTATSISSYFGPRIIKGTASNHGAIDIKASCADNVVIASQVGEVITVNNTCDNNGYYGNECGGSLGNYVEIQHADGVVTRYGHLYPNSIVVSVGDTVAQGEKIAMVGNSGSSTGCHLHFEVKLNGVKVDPLDYVSAEYPRPVTNYTFIGSGDTSDSKAYVCKSLLSSGLSQNAVAGVMSNFKAESGFISYRVQGDFSNGYATSVAYTEKVDSGEISRNDFINKGPGGGGYGLAQWTYYTRKANLYDFAKSKSASIGAIDMQLEFFLDEIKGYKTSYKYITGNYEAYDIALNMCLEFENPKNASTTCKTRATSNSSELLTYVKNGCS